ncbi:acyl-CoA thioesterase [Cumulibacter manganitolerans]|uniref:acyl-CoA thioesterase n=1 Tax=Cumulibacter manganitolerans TaxID=1884992 RepID=UPI001294FE3A|nr:acyl-CoA thioesterase domain-containing protein [Cumulibacter manganitolerans]
MTQPSGNDNLAQILDLERLDPWLYRSTYHFEERFPLYGGQVAGQAILAAGRTTDADRLPHSMHCYFLRGGDPAKPIIFDVSADFDGGSFSSRRVIAKQDGEVIFNCTVSFHKSNEGPEMQLVHPEPIGVPEELGDWDPRRLHSVAMKEPTRDNPHGNWPKDFLARVTTDLGDDPVLNAAGLIYLTDAGSGLADVRTPEVGFLSTIDHTVWLHRIPAINDWHLFNYGPRRTGGGRGLYTGSVFDMDGYLVATVSQECLFRYQRKRTS